MKLSDAERTIREALAPIYEADEAANIASILLEHLTGYSRTQRLDHKDAPLEKEKQQLLEQSLQRLVAHEPIQYVINKWWFYGMELYVDSDVLVPRPETEELVDWIVKDLGRIWPEGRTKGTTQSDATDQCKILDVGTGSGCIALALKRALPLAEVWGCDSSDGALNVARRNGSALNIRVDFQSVDFLDPAQQKHLPSVDVLVSNPPYIPMKDRSDMRPNVVQYEPHAALFVPDNDPLLFYKALVRFGGHRLHAHGTVYMEIHESLGPAVQTLFEEAGYKTELRKDMQGKDRMVKALLLH